VHCSLEKVKEHLIQYGREPSFRLWRGPGDRDSSDEEWEEELKTPLGTHEDGRMDAGIEVHSMVEDVFQENDEPERPLEETMEDGRHYYVSVERRAESEERRRNKNSKFDIPKKDNFKNSLEYTRNILESAKNSKKMTYFRGG
jgi:hypothetical protein